MQGQGICKNDTHNEDMGQDQDRDLPVSASTVETSKANEGGCQKKAQHLSEKKSTYESPPFQSITAIVIGAVSVEKRATRILSIRASPV